MEHEVLPTTEPPPHVTDAMIAMRVPSLVVFLASMWFMVTPLAYYGVSNDTSSLNCWFVGGLLVCSSILRLWFPLATVGFAWFNMIAGIWVFISPWVFGYTSETGRFVNTACLGAIIVGMSIASMKARVIWGSPLATAYEERQGLEEHKYDHIGPDRRWHL
jgi:hypothetical protein